MGPSRNQQELLPQKVSLLSHNHARTGVPNPCTCDSSGIQFPLPMQPLPIDDHLDQIVRSLQTRRSLVIVAPPGAGKTTRVPPAVLQAGLLDPTHPALVMLQPRRVAARASAARIAEEQGWELGHQVGYHVRFDRKLHRNTRLRVLTEGILTRQLVDDPSLPGIGCVVLDEFHERSLHTDIAIALLREIQQSLRPDLMLIVMSATLQAEPVAKFLGDCPILRTQGRIFPVRIEHELTLQAGLDTWNLPQRIAHILEQSIHQQPGDALVFLPGADEIRRTATAMQRLADRHNLLVLPLHGTLSAEEQTRALRPARQRKIVLATNIAETSLTIDGVRLVIDSGLARVPRYDPDRGLDRLELKRISKASAEQRAGRAGRTAEGLCVRLWSLKEHHALEDFELPEVRRVDLAGVVLALHAWGVSDPRNFGWYDPPDEKMLVSAERLLAMLGALDSADQGRITRIGRQMQTLPVHPRLARLMVEADGLGIIPQAATLAALLSEKEIVLPETGPMRDRAVMSRGRSDVLERIELLEQAEKSRFAPWLRDQRIDPDAARQVARVRDELLRAYQGHPTHASASNTGTGKMSVVQGDPVDALLKLVLLAYPDRVCRRRASDPATATMVGGGGVRLDPQSVVRDGEFFVAVDARHDPNSPTRQALVRIASEIRVEWLSELFPSFITTSRVLRYDEDKRRVIGRVITSYHDLVLSESVDSSVDPTAAGRILGQALADRATELFEKDDASRELLARVALLRDHLPEHDWPSFDPPMLRDIILEGCSRCRSLDEVGELSNLLRLRLVYPLDRMLDEHAPTHLTLPSGRRHRIHYSRGAKPVLAVRLQELFGLAQTPTIAKGRLPLLLHLLGPNFRPVQVTEDLASFWKNTYPQVRKDLRARYPKHKWPEEPKV